MAANLRGKAKATLPPRETSTAFTTPIEQLTHTAEEAGASHTLSQRSESSSPFDVAQLVAEQMAIARNDMAKLVSEQIVLALAARPTGNIQFPPEPGNYKRRDTVISSVEPLATHGTRSRDGPLRGTDA